MGGVSLLAFAPLAMAQDQNAGQNAAAPAADRDVEVVIVTGTSRSRVALDTPLAVTQLNAQSLSRLGSGGQADILNSVPTIKADGGGGEVAANIFVKGLPSGGQYQFTPLLYDGVPVLSSFGLNSSAYDVYYRNDVGIARLEFVRGGVSNLFGPGSVAGMINYISKKGSDTLSGTAQLEVAEKDRVRVDLALSGPISDKLFFSVSGFYRSDKGPLETNLDSLGGQIRGNLEYRFGDGSGSVSLSGQYIDDQTHFYFPLPLSGATRKRLAGNDGEIVNSVQNNFGPSLGFKTPTGNFVSEINDGVSTKGSLVAVSFDKSFGDTGFGINGRIKYSDYQHKFGFIGDGDGSATGNAPETLNLFLSNRKLGTLADANFTYVGGGTVAANALLFANRITDRVRPVHDLTGEINLTKSFVTGGLDHSVTLGGFYGDATAGDYNVTTLYLAEFNNRPRLVNLVVTNGTTQTIVSNKGLLNAGAGYANNSHSAERYAIYIADQIKIGEKFNLDIGFRVETLDGEITREKVSTFVTDSTTANLSGALRDVIWGNGAYIKGKVSTTEWAGAIGALYKASDRVSLYGNFSRGYFFPELRSVSFNVLDQISTYDGEIIQQGEIGLKMSMPKFSLTLAALATELDNRRQVQFLNDGLGGYIEKVNLVGTESYGVELTVDYRLTKNLRVAGNATLQANQYTAFDSPTSNIGKEVERQPGFLYNAGLYYDNGRLDASLFTNFTGTNYTSSNNSILLDEWNIVNFDAGYTMPIGNNEARFSINVFNLLDEDAVTEGSPRQDNSQTAGGAYFIGRPVLPRRISAKFTYSF
jgi:outer membrane receptor protein involved in Fe transport